MRVGLRTQPARSPPPSLRYDKLDVITGRGLGAKRLFKKAAMKAGLPRRCAGPGKGLHRLRARLGGIRGERGATLVEFALILIPFFVILFGIFEVGFVFWGTYELENATADAARQIRTGQIRANGGEAAFRTLVCDRVVLLSRCNTDLRLDVRSFNSFAALQGSPPAPLDNDGELKDSLTFNPGGPRSIVLVSTFYRWPLINPLSGYSISNMAGGARLLQASAAFRNEPFPDN